MTDSTRWILSFYRASEIQGALFFGRLARTLRDPAIVEDMTRHFADESRHGWLWTRCLAEMTMTPAELPRTYQDGYLEAAGLPGSLMEVLALTHVFERRVMRQYARHLRDPGLDPRIERVLREILVDERRHVAWVGRALDGLRDRHGDDVATTLARYEAADAEVHARAIAEFRDRLPAVPR